MSGLIQIEPQTITVKLSCGCEYVLGNLGREHNPCPNDEGQCPKCRRKVVVEEVVPAIWELEWTR